MHTVPALQHVGVIVPHAVVPAAQHMFWLHAPLQHVEVPPHVVCPDGQHTLFVQSLPGGQTVVPHWVLPPATHCPFMHVIPAAQHVLPQTSAGSQHWPCGAEREGADNRVTDRLCRGQSGGTRRASTHTHTHTPHLPLPVCRVQTHGSLYCMNRGRRVLPATTA
jgi:hypothetical protein